jgi:hypothetical protein
MSVPGLPVNMGVEMEDSGKKNRQTLTLSVEQYLRDVEEAHKSQGEDGMKSPVKAGGDSFSLIFTRHTLEDDGIVSDTMAINHNSHPLFSAHTHLFAVHDMLASNKLSDKVDIALVVRIPEELRKEIGSDKVHVYMGEDVGKLPPGLQNKIVDSILMYNVDGFLKEFLKLK